MSGRAARSPPEEPAGLGSADCRSAAAATLITNHNARPSHLVIFSPRVLRRAADRPPARPGTPPEDPRDYEPNPELIAAADAAVRDAMAERLRGLPKAELVETAMRVRKELLSKCRGELRALELRRKREERAAVGAMGGR